jgi:glycosyltransferase involved in cell wall biosynthesis
VEYKWLLKNKDQSTKHMKILLIHNDYQQAGGERVAVEAQIALLRRHNQELSFFLKDNTEINTYTALQKLGMVPRVVYSSKTYKDVRATVAETRPDVAHIHNVFPLISPAVYRALSDSGIPIVQTLHNFRFLCPNGIFYTKGETCELCKFGNTVNAVLLKCYRNSYSLSALYAFSVGLHRRLGTFQMIDHFIALTGFTAGKIIESGLANREKVSILGNFILENIPVPGEYNPKGPYVVYLGRLSPEKGVDILIRAMSGISGLELKIAGDGPQASELKNLARKLGLAHVTFLGNISGNQKWDLLRNAAAAIVPSLVYENLPFTLLESMAVGTPVIASDIGSLPYIIKDSSTGLLFQPGNPDDLREKLLWMTAHPKEALDLGRNGREFFNKRYSEQAHYNGLMDIYKNVVEGKKLAIGKLSR